MMMMSSWRQSCVQQSHDIMLGLTFCYSTPGMLLWAVQKLLKFPFEVKCHCQQASQRELLTLTLFSCGSFQADPQKSLLSGLPWFSGDRCVPQQHYLPTPQVQTMQNSLLQPHQKENETKDSQSSVPHRHKMSLQLQGFKQGLNFFEMFSLKTVIC